MQCLANALSLDGTLHRAEQKKRLTLLIVSFMGMLLPVVGMLMLLDPCNVMLRVVHDGMGSRAQCVSCPKN